ncbi:MAG: FAD-dependent oxidoreductase [Acidiphilium sp. 37-64-53]|uniref:NAD(P)/FAD-dependent oxidoreductase n=1 Tax=Acidiphilium TaxID=522 RepID=UPI000BCE2DA8|nr:MULTISPECIES: FAD-binding oxidoreductase [Acidiphilium]OYW00551.1 MAG: FAD-dependent oxidoreductase [Acidiphilium sp. 37-64-53]OZB23710.1 MAG: FAD-dependent oxidoreductase [Acidiphilium sp. 34-64-41]HQT86020.1 FAD-binding oxidoreductase [Acidiphilium rubrum]
MSQTRESGAAVVIIGAGVTGLSAAWWLARDGVDVLVLDKGVIGYEASSRNGGGATHYQSPLFHEEQRLWPLMDELLGYPTEHRPERIVIAMNEAQMARYQRMQGILAGLGYRADLLDPQQVRDAVPLAGDQHIGGVHIRTGGQANPQRTVQAYAWAAQDHGARIMQHTPVLGIEMAHGRAIGVRTRDGLIGCDQLIVAAGPQSGTLLRGIGIDLPVAPARAEMIVTEALPLMPYGGVDGNGLYGRQTLRGNLAYGGGWHEWMDELPLHGALPRPSTPVLQQIALRIAQMLPKAAHARMIRSWAGIIENTPDGRPVLDRPANPGNVTVATMSSVGFGLSPATGHALRDLVIDGRCSFADIDKLSLRRFDGLDPDWRRIQGWVTPATHQASVPV